MGIFDLFKKQDENKHEEFVIRRLIEELGYGLDLI